MNGARHGDDSQKATDKYAAVPHYQRRLTEGSGIAGSHWRGHTNDRTSGLLSAS